MPAGSKVLIVVVDTPGLVYYLKGSYVVESVSG
jgi:hypothetical protein